MTGLDLDAIEARAAYVGDDPTQRIPGARTVCLTDVPALAAEVRRLRAHLLLTEAGAMAAEAAIARVEALIGNTGDSGIDVMLKRALRIPPYDYEEAES